MLSIGEHSVANRVVLAPMAGVTDHPFRQLCRELGAGLAIAEMVSSNHDLMYAERTRLRMVHAEAGFPAWMQIVGAEPSMMADAAGRCVDHGAEIIDVNMGCPARKVCNRAAGAALLRDLPLAEEILRSVVRAVDVPVTLKMRTGWLDGERTAVELASVAEACGVAAVTIHGRSGARRFKGEAEYRTIAEVKQCVAIPVIANGDIDSPAGAERVMRDTRADAVMVGRAVLGRPWLIREIDHHLRGLPPPAPPTREERGEVIARHIRELHRFYGEPRGLRIARKHVGWYLQHDGPVARDATRVFNRLPSGAEQLAFIADYFASEPEERNIAA